MGTPSFSQWDGPDRPGRVKDLNATVAKPFRKRIEGKNLNGAVSVVDDNNCPASQQRECVSAVDLLDFGWRIAVDNVDDFLQAPF